MFSQKQDVDFWMAEAFFTFVMLSHGIMKNAIQILSPECRIDNGKKVSQHFEMLKQQVLERILHLEKFWLMKTFFSKY